MKTWRRWLLRAAVAALLALVFAAYLRPAFLFDVATRVALCL